MELTKPRFGRYEIERELGHGAMGIVYRAHDPVIDRPIAIKTLKLDLSDSELDNFRQRFLQEARLAGKLNHPNIVTIYDVGQADDTAYIAMEYLEGKELRQVLAEGNQLSFREIAEIVAKIADGLAYAHANGVIHRDIKPANIMLVRDNIPKVLDFGIAQLPAGTRTLTGAVIGSPKYMSPEQVQGRPLDRRSDLFSLGTVMYEMLTHKVPFEGETLASVVYQILHEMPAPPQNVSNNTPHYLARIVGKALAKNPDERYQAADEMAHDLRQYVLKAQAKTTIGKKTSADERPSLAIATDADGTARTVQLSADEVAVITRSKPAKSKTRWLVATAILTIIIAVGGLTWLLSRVGHQPPELNATAPDKAPPKIESAAPSVVTTPPSPSADPSENKLAVDTKDLSSAAPNPDITELKTDKKIDTKESKTKDAKKDNDAKRTASTKVATAAPLEGTKDTASPLPTKGTVVFAITPWGEVYVDGKKMGVSPPLTELQLSVGTHKIEVRNGDAEPHIVTVEINGTEPKRVKHRF